MYGGDEMETLRRQVEALNGIEPGRLEELLNRLIKCMQGNEGRRADDADFLRDDGGSKEALAGDLGLCVKVGEVDPTLVCLNSLLDCIAYHYSDGDEEKTAHSLCKKAGVNDGHARAISRAWGQSAKEIVRARVSRTATGPHAKVESVDYAVAVELASSDEPVTVPTPTVTLQLGAREGEPILMELSEEQLLELFNCLEVIQKELDTLK